MGRRRNSHRPPEKRALRHRGLAVSQTSDQSGSQQGAAHRDGILPVPASGTQKCRQVLAVGGFLLLAVALVFGQAVRHEFVNFDDDDVFENPHVSQGVSTQSIAWAFTHSHGNNWIPLTWISLMLDCQLYGLHAGGYHLTNVLLHAATAILLFLVLHRMTGRLWPSAFVAALFAVHPLRAESVAWVSERKDVLSGLFFMLTLAAYVSYVHHRPSLLRYLAVMVFFALGLMAKAMLVTLPLVLLLLDYWPLGRLAASSTPPHCNGGAFVGSANLRQTDLGRFSLAVRLVVEKLPLFALVAVSCVATVWAQGSALAPVEYLPLGLRTGNALISYVAYLGQLFFPVGLAVFYPHPEGNLPAWKIIGAMLVLAAISAGVWAYRRRRPYLLVGWLWYLGILVPVIGLVQVGLQAMADRYTYLTQIGLYISLVWAGADLCRSWSYRRWLCRAASSLVLVILMGCAWRQTSFWCDSEALWTHALACTSWNKVAYSNLARALADRGQVDAAIAHYQKALEIKPDFAEAHYSLGNALARRGQVDCGHRPLPEGAGNQA